MQVVDIGQKATSSKPCLVYKYILTSVVIQSEPYCLAAPRAEIAAGGCGYWYTLSLDNPHRPIATHAQCAARLLKGNNCATVANLRCTSCPFRLIQSFYFPFSAVAPEPTASIEVSIGVAPSALSFFSVKSRWCSITLRFLKYVTCAGSQHSSLNILNALPISTQYTHPTTRACALKFSELRRARFSCLLVFPYAVDNVVAIQALEETVAAVPAYCASTTVGCYETAVLRGCGRRRRRLRRRTAEPAHCEVVSCGES